MKKQLLALAFVACMPFLAFAQTPTAYQSSLIQLINLLEKELAQLESQAQPAPVAPVVVPNNATGSLGTASLGTQPLGNTSTVATNCSPTITSSITNVAPPVVTVSIQSCDDPSNKMIYLSVTRTHGYGNYWSESVPVTWNSVMLHGNSYGATVTGTLPVSTLQPLLSSNVAYTLNVGFDGATSTESLPSYIYSSISTPKLY